MEKETMHYKKIVFWGTMLGNLMILAISLCIIAFPIMWLNRWDSAIENPELVYIVFPFLVIVFCLPAFKLKRSAKIASDLLYESGKGTKQELVKSMPLPLKWLSREKEEMSIDEMIASYAKYIFYYALMTPFLFVVWINFISYPINFFYR